MTVNLEAMLPQAFLQTTPSLVPSNSITEEPLLLGDLLNSTSMYGGDPFSLVGGCDADTPLSVSKYLFESQCGENALYQTDSAPAGGLNIHCHLILELVPCREAPLYELMNLSLVERLCSILLGTKDPSLHCCHCNIPHVIFVLFRYF